MNRPPTTRVDSTAMTATRRPYRAAGREDTGCGDVPTARSPSPSPPPPGPAPPRHPYRLGPAHPQETAAPRRRQRPLPHPAPPTGAQPRLPPPVHECKQPPGRWHAAYGYTPVLVETFVETGRFTAASYPAANWIHVGPWGTTRRQVLAAVGLAAVAATGLGFAYARWRNRNTPTRRGRSPPAAGSTAATKTAACMRWMPPPVSNDGPLPSASPIPSSARWARLRQWSMGWCTSAARMSGGLYAMDAASAESCTSTNMQLDLHGWGFGKSSAGSRSYAVLNNDLTAC
jgi:hypothetical protein